MLSIRNLTKTPLSLSRAFLERVKDRILGEKYDLSLVIIGDALSRKLNRERRGKNKPANTLSFALSKDSGEIFLNPKRATKDVSLVHLFIHSLLHLEGFSHGSTMESKEGKYLASFARIHANRETHRNGN